MVAAYWAYHYWEGYDMSWMTLLLDVLNLLYLYIIDASGEIQTDVNVIYFGKALVKWGHNRCIFDLILRCIL